MNDTHTPERQDPERQDPERLPPPLDLRLLGGRPGQVLLRPWFDKVSIRWVTRVFFPLSRAWAAARAADGDRTAFLDRLPLRNPPQGVIDRLLDAVAGADARYREATARWQALYFGAAPPDAGDLIAAEAEREQAAQALMITRVYAFPLRLARRLPGVAFDIAGESEVEAAHAHRLAGPATAFPPPEPVPVTASHAVHGAYGAVQWLEWPSPLGDTARARVYTPEAAETPPTLIHLHGIGMEMEMWRAQADPVNALAATDGIRVIRPEGPWHGRRMLPGYHGGEPALAFAPKGYIDLIAAWAEEAARLIAWARATSNGPVAIGGLSLGALTAQIVATAARHWPQSVQPEVMFLICTSGDILEVSSQGAFARGLGVADALARHGWSHAALARWRSLLEPQGAPVMAPDKRVMLLGQHDSVTPYRGGRALARRWEVPSANLFVANRGHFSTPLGLHQDATPLRRAVALLKAAADERSGPL